MGSAEIAMTRDEMETEMDVVMDRENGDAMDAENGDAMDAKTTNEMTNEKDADIFETEKRVPLCPEKFLHIISILLAFA